MRLSQLHQQNWEINMLFEHSFGPVVRIEALYSRIVKSTVSLFFTVLYDKSLSYTFLIVWHSYGELDVVCDYRY